MPTSHYTGVLFFYAYITLHWAITLHWGIILMPTLHYTGLFTKIKKFYLERLFISADFVYVSRQAIRRA